MKILAIGCIHNDIENMFTLIDQISKIEFDAIVFPGDFTDLNLPRGFSRIDVAKIIIAELEILGKPIIAVPGSWDKELIEYLHKKKISVHGSGKVVNGVGFYGYGGARTPFGTPFEPADGEIELGLMKGFEDVKNEKIKAQITHMPPAGTQIDRIGSGAHVGSEAVRRFIEEKKPTVAISAHIHEGKGVDELGGTKIVNPGRFPEGSCALISIEKGEVDAIVLNLIEEIKHVA